jgi:hypothetical protein
MVIRDEIVVAHAAQQRRGVSCLSGAIAVPAMLPMLLAATLSIAAPLSARAAESWRAPGALSTAVDIDGDGVRNEVDNCREVFNPEQMDHDRDVKGDECDFTIYAADVEWAVAAEEQTQSRSIATLSNPTDVPVTWYATATDPVVHVKATGVVAPHSEYRLKASASDVPVGYASPFVQISTDSGDEASVMLGLTSSPANGIESTCKMDVYLDSARVSDDQGDVEGKMELEIRGVAGAYTSSTWSQKLPQSDSYTYIGTLIHTFDVSSPSDLTIKALVHSNDSGATGKDDDGYDDGTLRLDCNTSPTTVTLSASVPGKALAENDGVVKVKIQAQKHAL